MSNKYPNYTRTLKLHLDTFSVPTIGRMQNERDVALISEKRHGLNFFTGRIGYKSRNLPLRDYTALSLSLVHRLPAARSKVQDMINERGFYEEEEEKKKYRGAISADYSLSFDIISRLSQISTRSNIDNTLTSLTHHKFNRLIEGRKHTTSEFHQRL
jgi:hypothetical protein